jgi:prepilin-type processing-associated H-X9-DG protein/prepilin-type N-terminal cleavage/methylation domain-containing protein
LKALNEMPGGIMFVSNAAARRRAFTLVELLVVIGIIALLISILLPSLSKAREMGKSVKCLSNLRQLGIATVSYANESKSYLPYPTTTQGEQVLWFNCVDPYLQKLSPPSGRTGVAANREYSPFKQCVVYDELEGGIQTSGGQNQNKEFARTYKMNSHLRHNNPAGQMKVTELREPTSVVVFGDATSLDQAGPIDNQWESGQFSFEVDDKTQAGPALRHLKGANIAFADGHAEFVLSKTFKKNLRSPQNTVEVLTWESEFVDGSGNPVDVPDGKKNYASQGLKRNPNMPLIWGEPGVYYRP